MNGLYVFNGRSRTTHLSLSRDHQLTRDAIVARARVEREQRERDRLERQAALRIQRAVRAWLGRMALADRAISLFQSFADESPKTTERCLQQFCWDFVFVCRGGRRSVDREACRWMCTQVVQQQLHRSIRAGTLKGELVGSHEGLDLLFRLSLGEYARLPDGEEDETVWKKEHLFLLDTLLENATTIHEKGKLFIRALQFVVQRGEAGNESIAARIQNMYTSFSAEDVALIMQIKEGKEMLLEALSNSTHNEPYISPTACALHVLLASSHTHTCEVNEKVNELLVTEIVQVAVDQLSLLLHRKPTAALGKLVRLIPFFFDKRIPQQSELRTKWMTCLMQLTLHKKKKNNKDQEEDGDDDDDDGLLKRTLRDFKNPCSDGVINPSKYMHVESYLFSAHYGLRLLKENASSVASYVHSNTEGSPSSTSTTSLAQSEIFSEFDLLCSTFIWPLYNFAWRCSDQRAELTTIIFKLLNPSDFLRSLWKIYRDSHAHTFADVRGEKRESTLHQVKSGDVLHLPYMEPPNELLSTPQNRTLPRSCFWDPYPAISVLFFTLLSYSVDAMDFVEGLDHGTLMDRYDANLLILALKGIVHRSYVSGVLPHCNGEAVAQTALMLLVKLHVIDEVESFASHPSVWIATKDPLVLSIFDSVSKETWSNIESDIEACKHRKYTEDEKDSEPANGEKEGKTCMNGNNLVVVFYPQWIGNTTWSSQERWVRLLQNAPFIIPFNVRAAVFSEFLLSCREHVFFGAHQPFFVQREHVFIDAFDRYANNPESYDMLAVRFRDVDGNLEEGYGEGVYREFLVNLCTEGFAVEYGLFRQTEDGYVYPNPFSREVTGDPQDLQRIRFLGAMVGRGLRDGVLQDIPFAPHFRNTILGRSNSISNLKSFDKQMYRHLISLRSLSEEEIESLSLNFTYTVDILGDVREVELLRDGRNIAVTSHNCLRYIYLIAYFKLNSESAPQCRAFLDGLGAIVNLSWLKLFDSREIMKVFGGDEESAINVEDWRRHTQYHVPEDEGSAPVHLFWLVVEHMSSEERKKLLKFATSMNRPPLLGFQFFNPPFKLHVVWDASEDRLPSASTCFSTLKIPPYKDYETARRKIKAAIEETDDFGLS